MNIKRKNIFLISSVIIIVLTGSYLIYNQLNKEQPPRPGLVKVESFNYVEPFAITCQALIPSCGYCPGEVIDKECWVESN